MLANIVLRLIGSYCTKCSYYSVSLLAGGIKRLDGRGSKPLGVLVGADTYTVSQGSIPR